MAMNQQSVPAEAVIQAYTLASLQQMARLQGIAAKGKNREALHFALSGTLYDRGRIVRALKSLASADRAVLDRLILLGGRAPTNVLRSQLEAEGVVDPRTPNRYGYYDARGSLRDPDSRKFEDIVTRLGALGLVFSTAGYDRQIELAQPGQHLYIPAEILRHLPQVRLPVETAAPPSSEQRARPEDLHRDLYVLLSFARDEPIPLTSRDLIPKRALIRIDEQLRRPEGAAEVKSEAELGRLSLLRAMTEELKLLVRGTGGLRLGDGVDRFLSSGRGKRQRRILDAYRKTADWSELARLPGIMVTPRTGIYGESIAAARQRVLAELEELVREASLPAGAWIQIDQLVDRMRKRAYEFLLPRDWRYLYYGSSSYTEPSPYYGSNPLNLTFQDESGRTGTWETVEGAFIRVVVTEALHWLGVVDLGMSEDGSVISFRITEEGSVLLRGGTPSSATPKPHVVVQPNFQIFAFEPTGEDVLFTLDRLALRIRAEQVVEYHLTRESVYAAQRGGMETVEIIDFLERVGSAPLPQNVRRSLEEWGAQHDRIVVRRSTPLIHTLDEETLDSLYADPELSRLLGRRLAPTVALVPADHLDVVHGRLITAGASGKSALPALTEGDDAWDTPAIRVDANGRITFQQRLPSIYVRKALRPFADESQDGAWQLTPKSLRRGAKSRLKAEDMIATLETLHVGPLPEEVPAMVRRWAKNWGRGALLEVVLLQVKKPEVMADLLADPEIKRYLQPVSEAPTLATVKHAHVEQVRSLLEERGMDLQATLL